MKFNFDKYPGKYAMHCKTEKEAKEFCTVMHEAGRKWNNGESYLEVTEWNTKKNNTAYDFNNGQYASVELYQEMGYTILEWSTFRKEKEMTKSELKTGMLVECRNGKKYMALLDTPQGDIFVRKNGFNEWRNYEDDLHAVGGGNFDIVAVYRPDKRFQMTNKHWDDQTCIWRRPEGKKIKEVKEITLAEIAEKFGVDVKDIRIKED